MKISRTLLSALTAIVFLFAFEACSNDNDENENSYLYLPQRILTNALDTTVYTYDAESKIIGTAYRRWSDLAIISRIEYNSERLPQLYTSSLFSLTQSDSTLLYTLNRRFAYNEGSITVSGDRSDGVEVFPVIISLSSNGKLTKRSERATGKYTLYELDSRGNIVKTIDQDSTVCEYTYDDKRGVFREANMPAWFMQAVMSAPIDTIQQNGSEVFDIRNNHLSALITQKTDSADYVISGVYTNAYGGFGYPTQIGYKTNRSNITETIGIRYTAVNK